MSYRNVTGGCRQGISLAELLVVMSLCSVALTTSAALVHQIMRLQSARRSFSQVERNAVRLARQFRDDAHTAATFHAPQEDPALLARFTNQDNEAIEYRAHDNRIVRLHERTTGEAAREEYDFNGEIDARVERHNRMVELTVVNRESDASGGLARHRTLPIALRVVSAMPAEETVALRTERQP